MINRREFTIEIEAEKSAIWKAMWEDTNYRQWAAVFYEGTYAVTDNWKEGSIVHFLAPNKSGIYSNIEKHIPNLYIEFRHIGNVVDGKEQPLDEETKKWTGATEIYRIEENEGFNVLKVEIDIMDEHLEFMTTTFDKALETVKNICINK